MPSRQSGSIVSPFGNGRSDDLHCPGWGFHTAATGFVCTPITLPLIEIYRRLLLDRVTLPLLRSGPAANLEGYTFAILVFAVIGTMGLYRGPFSAPLQWLKPST